MRWDRDGQQFAKVRRIREISTVSAVVPRALIVTPAPTVAAAILVCGIPEARAWQHHMPGSVHVTSPERPAGLVLPSTMRRAVWSSTTQEAYGIPFTSRFHTTVLQILGSGAPTWGPDSFGEVGLGTGSQRPH